MEDGLTNHVWSLEDFSGTIRGEGAGGMRLIWKKWDEYNPVFIMVGTIWMVVGGYILVMMGVSGPLILWLLRAIPAIFVAMGLLVLIRQFQLRPKS
jgi:hypothetical protein